MTVLQWERIPADGLFIKKVRRELRMHRREKGRGGHEFIHDDIRVIWASGDDHIILTHNADRAWQFWWRHPEQSWVLQSWHRLLAEARDEADRPRIVELPAPKKTDAGLYVCAEWREPYFGERPLMIRCSSQKTASEIASVFESLGCFVSSKTVA
jgi:hypothetical protein